MANGVDFFAISLNMAVFLLCITIHEFSHAYISNSLGDSTAKDLGRMTLNPIMHIDLVGTIIIPVVASLWNAPLIGWAKPVPVNHLNLRNPKRDLALVSLAGPGSNILFAILFLSVFKVTMTQGILIRDSITYHFILSAFFVNVFLAVFNVLPIAPLDGSGILKAFVPERYMEEYEKYEQVGIFLLPILIFTGVLSGVIGGAAGILIRLITVITPGG